MNDELFKTLLRPFPQSFVFFLLLYTQKKEQVCAAFDPSGRKASLKEWWRGSVWGQKTSKRPFLLWLCCSVIPQSALSKWSCLFSVKLKNPYRHNTSRALLSRCASFFSLDIASANPHPPPWTLLRLSLPSSLLLSHCLPFKEEGSHLFLGYLPVAVMAACLIITGSSLAYFCFNSGKLVS